MKVCKNYELDYVIGGTTISSLSGTLVNSFANLIKVLMDTGSKVGSSIRRIREDSICPLE